MAAPVCALVMDFLSSSSSSDEDELIIALMEKRKKPKITNFMDVVDEFSEEEFRQNFRLEYHVACAIIQWYEASDFYPSDKNHGGSPTLTAKHDFLSFLWFAGNKVVLRDVSQRFGVAASTTVNQLNRVMDFLIHIASNIIKFPEDKEQAAADFHNVAQFPDVLGCIDGTSIKIRTPANKIKSTYVNRHDIPSITLQGVCDAKKRFIDVSVGAPAKIHDARVYELSDLSTELPRLCDGRYHLLGDSAYAIREWLLVPFRYYGDMTEDQKQYNRRFCSTRVLIENSFGLLKGRFRQLIEIDMHTVDKISKFITCCCVIHNLCIEYDDQCIFVDLRDEQDEEYAIEDPAAILKRRGEIKRDVVMHNLHE